MKKTPAEADLKKVASILDSAGHPGKDGVLEDLQVHLQEIALKEEPITEIKELENRLGSPEEYAENIAPFSKHKPKPLIRQKNFWGGIAFAALVFFCVIIVSSNRHTIAAHYRTAAGTNFVSSPFFDLERLKALKQGASAEEIRDAVGYPINRWQIQGKEEVVYWLYTKTPNPKSPFYTRVLITTDADELNLIRWNIEKNTNQGGMGPSQGIVVPPGDEVGSLTFFRPHGADPRANEWTLEPTDGNLYVIDPRRSVTSQDDIAESNIESWKHDVSRHWKGIPMENIRFVHCVGSDGKLNSTKVDAILEKLPVEARVYSGNHTPMELFGSGPHDIKLYSFGTLYHYPLVPLGNPIVKKAAWDDRHWVMRKLIARHQ
jgi:hypothetical protein